MKKVILKTILIFAIGAIGGIFSDQILWPYLIEKPLFEEYNLDDDRPLNVTKKEEVVIEENKALQNQVDKVSDVVIGIKTKTQSGTNLQGSGLILTSDGLIVTLSKLVPRNSKYNFLIEGKEVDHEILKRDPEAGLALVKLEKNDLSTAEFEDSLELGERVFLISKIGSKEIYTSVNQGIVKSKPNGEIKTNILEDAMVDGSPLFNIKGQIVGLNKKESSGKIISIPISEVREFSGF
ncbi:MAG: trypsin-like peptidase domain-containing protein [Minisyncoccales bacterium]